jgi:hypothetical protein
MSSVPPLGECGVLMIESSLILPSLFLSWSKEYYCLIKSFVIHFLWKEGTRTDIKRKGKCELNDREREQESLSRYGADLDEPLRILIQVDSAIAAGVERCKIRLWIA